MRRDYYSKNKHCINCNKLISNYAKRCKTCHLRTLQVILSISKKKLQEYYLIKKITTTKIGQILKCSATTVIKLMKKYKIKRRSNGNHARRNEKLDKKLTKSYLIEQYINKSKSLLEIANKFKISRMLLTKIVKSYNISIRTTAESLRLKYHKYPELHPFLGKHHTKEAKRKMKLNRKNIFGKNNPMFGKVTHGKWGIYKGIKMRSSYEVLFAQFLSLSGIKWKYESKTFDLGNTTYTPDFYIPKWDLYIEIKGWWRDDARRKYRQFRSLYSNTSIKILNNKKLLKYGVII